MRHAAIITSAAIANEDTNTTTRVLAAFVFACVLVCGLLAVVWFVRVQVQQERRSVLIEDTKTGYLKWVDATPNGKTLKLCHTGFTSRYGALFKECKDGDASVQGRALELLYDLLVGVFIGAMQVQPDPDDASRRERQTTCLIAVCSAFLLFIVVVRPYLLALVNVLKGFVVCAQIACLSTNYAFVRESNVASANLVYWMMPVVILQSTFSLHAQRNPIT